MKVAGEVQVDVFHGNHLGHPAPAAPPFMPKQGPREGSRRQIKAFLPRRLSASPSPTTVVVLPSPAGVGEMAVTRMSFPFSRSLGPESRTLGDNLAL